MLHIAVPNGTLERRTVALFQKVGIILERNPRCYTVYPKDSRVARVSFMRPQMVPSMVERGLYDIGITGSDWVAETQSKVTVLGKLDYSGRGDREWRVVLLGAKHDSARGIKSIRQGLPILSEFPKLTKDMLDEAGINAPIEFSYGSTEAHIPHDFAYGVCIASTEETLRANNLKIIDVISVETTVIISSYVSSKDQERQQAIGSLLSQLTWQ